MVPTKRLLLVIALGIPVAIIAGLAEVSFLFYAYNLAWILLASLSYYLAPSTSGLLIRRKLDPVLSVRVPNKVEIEIVNDGEVPIEGRFRDESPPFFETSNRELKLSLEPGGEESFSYEIVPPYRGSDFFRGSYIRLKCPLGLVEKDVKLLTEQPVRVYPNVLALREFDLLKQKGQLKEMGVRISRMRGLGTEFESLRDYAEGDDFRKIDWKATARRGKMIVRQFEQERNQPVIVVVDIGRRMLSEVNGVSKLDHVLDSVLMLLHAASVSHDLIGLLVYSDRVVRYIPPRKGRNQMGVIIEAIHDLVAQPLESNPTAAFSYLSSKWKRRALIVAFSDVENDIEARKMATAMKPLANRHVTLLARIADPRLMELTKVDIADEAALYSKSAALKFVDERKRAGSVISNFGIHGLESEPQDLAAALVSFYFFVKDKSLL